MSSQPQLHQPSPEHFTSARVELAKTISNFMRENDLSADDITVYIGKPSGPDVRAVVMVKNEEVEFNLEDTLADLRSHLGVKLGVGLHCQVLSPAFYPALDVFIPAAERETVTIPMTGQARRDR